MCVRLVYQVSVTATSSLPTASRSASASRPQQPARRQQAPAHGDAGGCLPEPLRSPAHGLGDPRSCRTQHALAPNPPTHRDLHIRHLHRHHLLTQHGQHLPSLICVPSIPSADSPLASADGARTRGRRVRAPSRRGPGRSGFAASLRTGGGGAGYEGYVAAHLRRRSPGRDLPVHATLKHVEARAKNKKNVSILRMTPVVVVDNNREKTQKSARGPDTSSPKYFAVGIRAIYPPPSARSERPQILRHRYQHVFLPSLAYAKPP